MEQAGQAPCPLQDLALRVGWSSPSLALQGIHAWTPALSRQLGSARASHEEVLPMV